MPQPNKFLLSQTLISSWLFSYKTDNGYEDFLSTLRRERKQPTKCMLDGTRFESVINAVCDGAEIYPDHEWYKPVKEVVEIVGKSQKQVKLYRDIKVNGVSFLINGVLDFLYAGQIFDTKFSANYYVGKYLNSPQTAFYFYLVPEAYRFTYLVSEGKYLYKEVYTPDQVEPIEKTISDFMRFLDQRNLVSTYTELWKSKY